MTITVCIVDDNKDIRSALEQIIIMSEGYRLLGSFPSAEEAIEKIPALSPQVVLMDINLGGMSGIECVRQLKPMHPDILYMMCTVYGYILKKTAPGKLLEAIKELSEGGAPMSSQIARKVVAAFRGKAVSEGPVQEEKSISILSGREKEILEHLSKGLLYKEIANNLFISPETVRKHVYHIYEKLHVNNRVEAVNKYFGR
jgi:DNA-binding NarL/FixJ family response regulator